MKDVKLTPKLNQKKSQPQKEKSTSGKKLVQAKLAFKILSPSPKPPQTSIDPNFSNAGASLSVHSTENSDIRKRKLSYSSDNDTAVTKILKPNTNLNEKSNAIEVVHLSDDSDDTSMIVNSPNSKQDTNKGKLNSKLVIKLPISSKKKRKKLKEDTHETTSNTERETSFDISETENPKKKLKPTEIANESTELKNDEKLKLQHKIESEVIIVEEVNQNRLKSNVHEAKHPDEIGPMDGNKIVPNSIKKNSDQVLEDTTYVRNELEANDVQPQNLITFPIEDEDLIFQENDTSFNITADSVNLSATKKSSKVAGKKLEKELQRQKEKEEKERQKRLEKEEKEDQRRKEKEEKEELKRKEKEEKEKKRLEEIELKNEEKRLKENERKKKEEFKEEERKKREDEKRKKEIEKEEAENKKKKAAEAFTKFFVQSKSNAKPIAEDEQNSLDSYKSEYRAFMPFEVKPDMTLAPIVRKNLPSEAVKTLEKVLNNNVEVFKSNLYLSTLKSSSYKPGSFLRTLPKDVTDSEDILIVENEMQNVGQPIDDATKSRVKYRAKYFLFHENRRPPYYGTWRKKSSTVTPRKPLSMDKAVFDYEIDSDDEWEEEEAGESLHGSDDEKESEDEYEVDNDFFVPHGHLSDEELLNDDEMNDTNSPQNQKAKLKILQQEFAQEMKKKTEKIKPKLYGIFWADENGNQSESCPDIIWNSLNKRSMIFAEPFLLKLDIFDEAGTSPKQSEKKISKKTEFPEEYIKELIKLTHGNRNKKQFIINEFLAHITKKLLIAEQNSCVEYTKKSIQDKINEIAVWKAHLDESQSKKKTLCWTIHPEILVKYDLSNLSIINDWSYILNPRSKKELINKNTDLENDTRKIKNITESTIKKFTISSKDEITDTTANIVQKNIPGLSHLKKRVQLISTPLNPPISSETKINSSNSFLKNDTNSSQQINMITSTENVED